jgi:hypothetical protein
MLTVEPGSIRNMDDFQAALEAVLAFAFRNVGHVMSSGDGHVDLVIEDSDLGELVITIETLEEWLVRTGRLPPPPEPGPDGDADFVPA